MAELGNEDKHTIVLLLAQFHSPAQVAAYMRQEVGLDVPIQQIVKYDPTRCSYEAGERWRPIFEASREKYLKDVSNVPVAHQAYRLNLLQEAVDAARRSRNWRVVAELLGQAAKEIGGVFTNSRQLSVSDGRRARDMTSDERRELLGSMISEALQRPTAKTKH
jgi:hypothetical protein